MKVPLPLNPILYRHKIHAISSSLRSFFCSSSTDTLTRALPSPFASLRSRIWKVKDPSLSVAPVLQKWVDQGNHLSNQNLQKLVRILRKSSRFVHALQISQWMSDRPEYKLSQGDVGIRLDLISRAHGLEQAEVYFDSIPETWRGFEVYGALLNSYAHHKCLEKAEVIMQQMRERGFLRNTLSYNVMLNLYFQMEKHEKADILVQEMEKKGISFNRVTYRILLNACAATSNVEEMEKLLTMMEAVPCTVDWHAYVVATNAFLKAGLTEKILIMLKRSERFITLDSRRFAYESLLTSYAAIGNKDELCRIWNWYKDLGKFSNSVYLCMINSLVKLDDIDGAERLLEESETNKPLFDARILDVMTIAYSKKGRWKNAEVFVNMAVQNGKELRASAWDHLATAYCVDSQMAKAVEALKKAILASEPGWKPNTYALASCLEYLKLRGDTEGAEELLKIFRADHRFLKALEDYAKQQEPGYRSNKAFVQMEGDDQTRNGDMPQVMEFDDKNTT